MTASTFLGPLIGVWIGCLVILIYTWTWKLECYLAILLWLLLGIPIFLATKNLFRRD